MRDKLYELIKSKGIFNGDVMGVDTYIIPIDDLVDGVLKLFEV